MHAVLKLLTAVTTVTTQLYLIDDKYNQQSLTLRRFLWLSYRVSQIALQPYFQI